MAVPPRLPGYEWFRFLRNAEVRVGIYTGVCLSLVFTVWLICANHVPALENVAEERNVIAAMILLFFASLPVLRFYREPSGMLFSGLLGWSLLAISYRLLSMRFYLLEERYSAFDIFAMGAIVYLIAGTVSWIAGLLWKARAARASHS